MALAEGGRDKLMTTSYRDTMPGPKPLVQVPCGANLRSPRQYCIWGFIPPQTHTVPARLNSTDIQLGYLRKFIKIEPKEGLKTLVSLLKYQMKEL